MTGMVLSESTTTGVETRSLGPLVRAMKTIGGPAFPTMIWIGRFLELRTDTMIAAMTHAATIAIVTTTAHASETEVVAAEIDTMRAIEMVTPTSASEIEVAPHKASAVILDETGAETIATGMIEVATIVVETVVARMTVVQKIGS